MVNAIYRALGIQTQDSGKLVNLGPIFFLTGLIYAAGIIMGQSLFVSRVGVACLPLMYLAEAGILPLQLWLISHLSQKMAQGSLIRGLYLMILAGMVFCGLCACGIVLFHLQWRGFYPMLFLMCSILLRILVPLMWMLGNGICLLQQAKRLFPILGALFTLGATCAGLLTRSATAFLAESATEIVLLIVPVFLLISYFLWRRIIARYFLTKNLEAEEKRGAPMKTVIGTVWRAPLLRLALFGCIVMMSLYYLVDYQFFMFSSRKFPASADLTRFYGMFIAILYSVTLLVNLVLNRLIKGLGIGKTIVLTGIMAAAVLAGSGLMARTSWALPAFSMADLLIDVLAFALLPMINEVFYKLLPDEQRAGASLLFAGSINAVGKLLSSAITGLHSSGMISLLALSLLGTGMAFVFYYLAIKQKRFYIATLLGSLQSHIVKVPELESFAPGKMIGKSDLLPLQEALQSGDSTKQLIALEFGAQIKNEALVAWVEPFLSHADSRKRLLAFQAIPDNFPGLDQICLKALGDPDQEIRCEAIRRMHALDASDRADNRNKEILINQFHDSSPAVIRESIIALYNAPLDQDLKNRIEGQIRTMLRGDDESRYQVCQALEAVQGTKHAAAILEMAQRESSNRVRAAAVNCLGALGHREAIPWLLASYSSADRDIKTRIERAILEIAQGANGLNDADNARNETAAADLAAGLDGSDMDTWYLRISVLAELDRERRFEKKISQSCEAKLKSWRVVNEIPAVLEKAGLADLASLYRQRTAENCEAIFKACWRTLAVYCDPVLVQRLQPALARESSAEKREQAVEILAELSQKYPLTAEMASAFQGDAPAAKQLPASFIETIGRAKAELPDDWLGIFADYAIAHFQEGGA